MFYNEPMSTAQPINFQIETLTTTAFVFASDNPFVQSLIQLFQRRNCQVHLNPNLNSFNQEADYALFLADHYFQATTFTHFLEQFPKTKVFLILPPSKLDYEPPTSSNLTTIYLGEIYDCHFLNPDLAPYLYQFISLLNQPQPTITLPGDGLFSIFPLSQADAIKGLDQIIFNPYLGHKQILLQSLHDISLLSLAHKLKSLASTPINLRFDPQLPPLYSLPPSNVIPFQQLAKFIESNSLQDNLSCLIKAKLLPSPSSTTLHSHQKNETTLSPSSYSSQQTSRQQPPQSSRPRLKPLFPTPKPKSLEEIKQEVKFVKLKSTSQQSSKPSFLKRHSRFFKRFFRFFFLGFFVYLLTLILALTTLFFSGKNIFSHLRQFQSPSKTTLTLSQTSLRYLSFNLHCFASFPFLNHSTSLQQLDLLTQLSLNPGMSLLYQTESVLPKLRLMSQHILGQTTIDFSSNLSDLVQSLDFLYSDLSLLTLKLPDKLSSLFPQNLRILYQKNIPQLHQLRQQLFILKTIAPSLTSILGGQDESRKYLVLLQNNTELRPTGGFIGSFAIVEFDNAQLFNFQVFDVYQADGQLKGHVEPPEPIKKYLGEANWYLRDSNWDPSFPVSATRAEWFARKTIKQDFDGVIAINLNFVQSLLRYLGPIELPDYNETITADNLFERAEYHSEIGFFPGSTQKKDFLATLTNQLFNYLKTSASNKDLVHLLLATLQSLNSHDILIYLNDSDQNSIIDLLGWSGRLQSPQCPFGQSPSHCLQDYLYIVDANLGVNKANYFLRRAINLQVNITKQLSLTHQLKITYTNTATSTEWPAGTYKNYQRLYLPYDAQIESVLIDNNPLNLDNISTERVGGKTVIGYLVEVPINRTVQVTVNYYLKTPLPSSTLTYSLYWQRQPGTNFDPLTITLHYPLFLHPETISPKAELSPQQLNFELISSQDRRISVQFTQQ